MELLEAAINGLAPQLTYCHWGKFSIWAVANLSKPRQFRKPRHSTNPRPVALDLSVSA